MPAATLTAEFDRLIQVGPARFTYYLRLRDDAVRLHELLADTGADRFILITDRKAPARHVARMQSRLAAIAPCTVQAVTAGEDTRTLNGLMDLADAAIQAGVTGRSVVVAFGGDLAGNVAGLLAALLLEGIRLVHIPTTLLAMTDSALSLKQSAYSKEGRPLLTKFHGPEFVWADLNYAKPPPATETRSALCEMIKLVLAIAPDRFDWVAARLRPDARYTTWDLADFTAFCIDSKLRVMAGDPRETGQALALEYGHAIGRAIEALVPGGMSHGLAIGMGMLAAARVAGELGLLTASDQHAHRVLLERAGAPSVLPYRVPAKDFLDLLHQGDEHGSRQPRPATIGMVLLDRLGSLHRDRGSYLSHVPDRAVARAVTGLLPPLPARPRIVTRAPLSR
jgi:3-dehydroquinate synthase/2-deoxy-scyllo-inosose synthase